MNISVGIMCVFIVVSLLDLGVLFFFFFLLSVCSRSLSKIDVHT